VVRGCGTAKRGRSLVLCAHKVKAALHDYRAGALALDRGLG